MALFARDLGIDLGTSFTRMVEGKTLILEVPTVVAIDVHALKIVEVGQEAQNMEGRVPESIEVAHPLKHSVIADYEITEKLLTYLVRKVSGPMQFFKPRVMISVPYGVTSVERRAVHEAILQAGCREAFLIAQPLAAAIGADLPIGTPTGNMILCLGAGSTQAAVIAMNDIVSADTLRKGGLELDDAIISYLRKKYNLVIGQPTAEKVKIQIGAAVPQQEELSMEIQGQDQVTGLPRPITLQTSEIIEALQEPLMEIVETTRRVLEKTPPELVSDIIDRGLAICGGSVLLRGLDKLLTKNLGVPAYTVDQPEACVALGAARALDMGPILRRSLIHV